MAEANRTCSDAPTIRVRISPVMEREFKRREIFPDLRLEVACRILNGATGDHEVSIERAKELLADARAMRDNSRELPRGVPVAYTALGRNIQQALCNIDEAMKRAAQSPAPARPAAQASAQILRLVPRRPAEREVSAHTIEVLQNLLLGAMRGEYVGLAYAVRVSNGRYFVDTAGECAEDPTHARGMVCALDDELSHMIHEAAMQ